MEQAILRKVQLTQLEIAKEIRRVCEENGIHFFLDGGTFLGAVRHKGFIPWDDDMDVGMLRQDYETFCRIAPQKLGRDYVFQSWHTDPNYALPFGKVLKKGTLYIENKKTTRLAENGIYVDVFPFDDVPDDAGSQKTLAAMQLKLYRTKLMKSGYRPWMEEDRIILKKRLGYVYYQMRALFADGQKLARDYDALCKAHPAGEWVCEQEAKAQPVYFRRAWLEDLTAYAFEGETFPGVRNYDGFLSALYGDYMTLPPEDQRENRHQIVQLDFGDGA